MNRMTIAEWCKLEGDGGPYAVIVHATGFGLCGCGLPHGTAHEHRWGGGLSKAAADVVAANWNGRVIKEPKAH